MADSAADAPAPTDSERYHALDALRAGAMLLGILLHGAISFMEPPVPVWPAADRARSQLMGGFVLAVHAFRLQVFFLMAGFFAHLLWTRRGTAGFVAHRAKRIALPLALSCVTIVPLTQALFVVGLSRLEQPAVVEVHGLRFDLSAYQQSASALEFFTSGRFVTHFLWFHLWFLWYLLVVYGLTLAALPIGRAWVWLEWPDRCFRWIMKSPWQPMFLAVPTFVLMLPMITWQADSPARVLPEWRIVAYYAWFYACGWLIYRHRDLLATCGRCWAWYLPLAACVVFPCLGFFFMDAPMVAKETGAQSRLPALAAYSLFTWLTALGLLGLFQRCFARSNGVVRYVSDSAYWLYLAHLPVVLLLQIVIAEWPGGPLVKFALLSITATLVLLASYHFAVRHTWIGALLSGKRMRHIAKEAPISTMPGAVALQPLENTD